MKSQTWLLVLLILFIGLSVPTQAQDETSKFLEENIDDAEKLVTAYIGPFMKSVSAGMNQGWYNTAKAHKIAGIDLTITVNAMAIPNSEMYYEPSKLGLKSLELANTSPDYPKAPTIFGSEREPVFRVKDPNSSSFGETFQGPPDIDIKQNLRSNKMPVPMAHFGIGLPKGTDLKIRFTPALNLNSGDTQLRLFGIGIMHDIKQWIPGIKTLPFDLSGFVGFTKFKLETKLEEDKSFNENPHGVFEMNATTIQGVISKKLSVLTLYGGLGYNIAKSRLAVLGKYDINGDSDYADKREVDPLDLKFAASGPRATAGFRLKLAIFTLHADYTLQKYSCLTAGFGLSIR
jgi:hypothetical protein